MAERLPTELWVKAHAARCSAQGISFMVMRRGDQHRGVVIAKLHLIGQGFRVVAQARDLEGDLVWAAALEGNIVPEADADAYIERQVSYDPDIWVIEVELRGDDEWFRGPVI